VRNVEASALGVGASNGLKTSLEFVQNFSWYSYSSYMLDWVEDVGQHCYPKGQGPDYGYLVNFLS